MLMSAHMRTHTHTYAYSNMKKHRDMHTQAQADSHVKSLKVESLLIS